MDIERLRYKLQEFHTLECYQVQLFNAFVKKPYDPYFNKAFERFAAREEEHVRYYEDRLKDLGETPSRVINPTFKMAGLVMGKALGLLSLKEQLRAGILAEKLAVKMYSRFIKETADNPQHAELNDFLWKYMIDEETHQFWFNEQLAKMIPAEDLPG